MPPPEGDPLIPLCNSRELVDGGLAVGFDVVYAGQTCRAFAVRYQGRDWQPDRIFDDSGRWLLCASHGAQYEPATGECRGGPCRGGLIPIGLAEHDGVVHWRSQYNLKLPAF
ncbi:MAG: Rieske (2Fe-2S) protein [Hydrogenophaga sp.]|nr:Rieske (2Fe-2S) protein [Hydrogenophaga sp.]